jgi:hypothetical protein
MTSAPDNTGQKQDGRFDKAKSGNPTVTALRTRRPMALPHHETIAGGKTDGVTIGPRLRLISDNFGLTLRDDNEGSEVRVGLIGATCRQAFSSSFGIISASLFAQRSLVLTMRLTTGYSCPNYKNLRCY